MCQGYAKSGIELPKAQNLGEIRMAHIRESPISLYPYPSPQEGRRLLGEIGAIAHLAEPLLG
jgi:hypothetical protein